MKKWILFLNILILLLCEQKITVKLNITSDKGSEFLGIPFYQKKNYISATPLNEQSAVINENTITPNVQGEISVEIKLTNIGADLSYMFDSCTDIVWIDLSNFNTSSFSVINNMFSGCTSLQSLDLSNFDTSRVNYMSDIFSGCTSLQSLNLFNYKGNDIFNSIETQITLNICTNNPNLIENYPSLRNKNITLICLNKDKTSDIESTYIETTNIYKVLKSFVWTHLINYKSSSDKVIESSLIKTNDYYKSSEIFDKSSEIFDKSTGLIDKSTRLVVT